MFVAGFSTLHPIGKASQEYFSVRGELALLTQELIVNLELVIDCVDLNVAGKVKELEQGGGWCSGNGCDREVNGAKGIYQG